MKSRHAGLPLLIALASVILPAAAHAGPWLLSPNEYYTELRGSHFSSDRMWDADGESVNLHSLETLEQRSITSYTEIGWKDWLSVSMDVPFQSHTLRIPSPHAHLTETGFADLTFGARIGLMQGMTAAALDVMWTTPAGYYREAIPPLGRKDEGPQVLALQGTNDITAKLSLGSSLPTLNTFFQVSGGYRLRIHDRKQKEFAEIQLVNSEPQEVTLRVATEDPPAEFIGSADVGVWASTGILISGHYRTFLSMGSATLRTAPDLRDPSIKPQFWPERSVHAVGLETRLHTDTMLDIFAGWSHVLAGKNTMDVDDIYVGVSFRETTLNRLQGFLGNKQAP